MNPDARAGPSRPLVAITGGAGFVGGGLLAALAARPQQRLRVLVHRTGIVTPEGSRLEVVPGDLLSGAGLDRLIEPGCVLINLSYLSQRSPGDNLTAATNLAEACVQGRAERLIHCSTAVVAGAASAKVIDENTICRPVSDYEKVKLQIEEILVERSRACFEVTILRPTAVFGPGGRNLMKLADEVMNGNPLINYLRACLFNRRSMNLVCLDNVVAALVFLLDARKGTDGQVFIVSDDDCPGNNYLDVESLLRQRLRQSPYRTPIVPLPAALLRALLRLSGRSGVDPEVKFSAGKLTALGFQRPVSLDDGLEAFARWYKSRPANAPGV